MQEVKTELRTSVIMNKDIKENLNIIIEDNRITLNLNPSKMFNNLLYREVILGLINKELLELLEKYLSEKAKQEDELNKEVVNDDNTKRRKF